MLTQLGLQPRWTRTPSEWSKLTRNSPDLNYTWLLPDMNNPFTRSRLSGIDPPYGYFSLFLVDQLGVHDHGRNGDLVWYPPLMNLVLHHFQYLYILSSLAFPKSNIFHQAPFNAANQTPLLFISLFKDPFSVYRSLSRSPSKIITT